MRANEKTSLLPSTNNGIMDESSPSGPFQDDDQREVAKMKQVTHNDPQLTLAVEDYKNLLGSTRLLYNNVVQDEMISKLRRQSMNASAINSQVEGGGANSVDVQSKMSLIYSQQRDHAVLYLEKVKHSFFEDAKSLAEGTVPQSIVLALGMWIFFNGLWRYACRIPLCCL